MKHSHPDGAKPPEIFAYAKWKLSGGPPLLTLGKQGTSAPADVDMEKRRVRATLPEAARVYYLNLFDAQGRIVSTEHESR